MATASTTNCQANKQIKREKNVTDDGPNRLTKTLDRHSSRTRQQTKGRFIDIHRDICTHTQAGQLQAGSFIDKERRGQTDRHVYKQVNGMADRQPHKHADRNTEALTTDSRPPNSDTQTGKGLRG